MAISPGGAQGIPNHLHLNFLPVEEHHGQSFINRTISSTCRKQLVTLRCGSNGNKLHAYSILFKKTFLLCNIHRKRIDDRQDSNF